jgi:hypothetical protein
MNREVSPLEFRAESYPAQVLISYYSHTISENIKLAIHQLPNRGLISLDEPAESHFVTTTKANIAQAFIQVSIQSSSRAHIGNVHAGIRVRMDTPPETKYRKGIRGSIRETWSSGNCDSSILRSRLKIIQREGAIGAGKGAVTRMTPVTYMGFEWFVMKASID